VIDLYGNPFYAALAQVVETLRHAPYWHDGEKAPTRLDRARELVRNSRVLLQDERLASVYGSTKAYDVTGFHCTCPQSQKGQSSWCVHAVAVKLARTMAEQGPREAAPVALGTLRPGTLPLPPVTAEERLAQAATVALDYVYDALHTPQEDRMSDGDTQYIPEPDHAPVAVLDGTDADFPPLGQPATRPLPGPVLLPALDAQTLERSMQAYAAQRQVVTRYIKEQMTEGVDYYTLTIKGRVSKATLSKAGSEKFLSLFQLSAQFQQDEATWRMLGAKEGLLCYTCMLMTRSGEVIGEGRGARSVSQDGGDINKAIKMATKSAQVDAVLRTGALSDVFTQDISDHDEETPAHENAQEQRGRIWAIVKERAPEAKTREAVETWIKDKTGMDLHPDLYGAILARLRG
jgi:hypothetical protein